MAVAASIGFLQHLDTADLRWDVSAAILLGGLLAAIPAAWLVRHVDDRAWAPPSGYSSSSSASTAS